MCWKIEVAPFLRQGSGFFLVSSTIRRCTDSMYRILKGPASSQVPETGIVCLYTVALIAFCHTCASWRRRMRTGRINR